MVRAGLPDKMLSDAEEASSNMTVGSRRRAREQELRALRQQLPHWETEWVEFLQLSSNDLIIEGKKTFSPSANHLVLKSISIFLPLLEVLLKTSVLFFYFINLFFFPNFSTYLVFFLISLVLLFRYIYIFKIFLLSCM